MYIEEVLSHTHILCSLYLLCAFRDFAASEVQIPFQSHFDKKNHQAKDTDAVDAVWINDQPQLLSWIGPPLTIESTATHPPKSLQHPQFDLPF